jgi:hypothetical protein
MNMDTKTNRKGRNKSESLAAAKQRLGAVEYVPTASLKSYAGNSRRHPERQLSQLMASIRTFGIVMPILTDVGGTIVAGHARVEAARRLRVTKVPVLVTTGWTEAQIRAYRLAENRLAQLGQWDEAQLATELSVLVEIDELPLEAFGWQAKEIDLVTGGSAASASAQKAPRARNGRKLRASQIGDCWWLGFYLFQLSKGELESPFGRSPPATFFAICAVSALRRWALSIGIQPVLPNTERASTMSGAPGS